MSRDWTGNVEEAVEGEAVEGEAVEEGASSGRTVPTPAPLSNATTTP